MIMSHDRTFWTVLTLIGMVASLHWPTVVQAGGGGERCRDIISVHGRLPGGTFSGELVILNFDVNEAGQLLASGFLTGTAKVHGVTQDISEFDSMFTDVVVELLQAGRPNVCDILILNISLIHLERLNLDLDLSRIILNITVPQRPCPPAGQLFCPLAGLLDSSPPNLQEIQRHLKDINDGL